MPILKKLFLLSLIWIICACGTNDRAPENAQGPKLTQNPDSLTSSFILGDWTATFEGELDEEYPIQMQLKSEGGRLSGKYAYKGRGSKSYPLEGTLHWNGEFNISEKNDKGEATGNFSGYFTSAYTMEGTWASATGGEPMPFALTDGGNKPADLFPSTPVQGFPGLQECHHVIFCPDGNSKIGLAYPRLQGLSSAIEQEAINRDIRAVIFSDVPMVCESTGPSLHITLIVSLLDGKRLSFYTQSETGLRLGLTYDLVTGSRITLDDVSRDSKALMVFLHNELKADDKSDIQFTQGKDNFTFFIHGGNSVVTIPVSHPRYGEWFREIPHI